MTVSASSRRIGQLSSDDNGDAARTGADKSGEKTAILCPMCIEHYADGALPPPQPALIDRIPLTANIVYSFQQRIIAYAEAAPTKVAL